MLCPRASIRAKRTLTSKEQVEYVHRVVLLTITPILDALFTGLVVKQSFFRVWKNLTMTMLTRLYVCRWVPHMPLKYPWTGHQSRDFYQGETSWQASCKKQTTSIGRRNGQEFIRSNSGTLPVCLLDRVVIVIWRNAENVVVMRLHHHNASDHSGPWKVASLEHKRKQKDNRAWATDSTNPELNWQMK